MYFFIRSRNVGGYAEQRLRIAAFDDVCKHGVVAVRGFYENLALVQPGRRPFQFLQGVPALGRLRRKITPECEALAVEP